MNFNNNQSGNNTNNNTTAGLGATLNWKIPTGGNLTLTWQGQNKLSQEARKLAEAKVINAKERMRLSSSVSMTDIINFEKSLVDAQNKELNAIINHLNSMTQLEQFLGITLNQWLKT